MKKITLILCFSIVGFIGFSQQQEKSQKLTDSDQVNSITIKLGNHVDVVKIDQTLVPVKDLKSTFKFNDNSHEFVHNKTTTKNFEHRIVQDAFTYNNYVINYDVDPVLNGTIQLSA